MKSFNAVLVLAIAVIMAAAVCPAAFAAKAYMNADDDVNGLWLRVPDFPDDAEVVEFTNDGDEVTFTRAIDDGAFVLGIYRMPAGDESTPEKLKEAIAENVKQNGGDPDDINFDSSAEDFAELLSYPCITAEYETGEDEDAKQFAVIGVFTDEYAFMVQVACASDSFDDYSGRSEGWFRSMTFVGGEDGRGDTFDDEEGDEEEEGRGDLIENDEADAGNPQKLDLDTAAAAEALEVYGEVIETFKAAEEPDWYGTTTDDERVEMADVMLKIFSDLRADTGDWEPGSFAQAMNDFYDERKDLSVWDTACMILGVDPEAFNQ
jgi:hypothetical protein